MLRRFLFLGAGAFALMVVLGGPGQLHAQGFRRGGFSMVQPGLPLRAGFPGGFRPGFQGRFDPRFNRGFDRRFDTGFNRGFFDPRFSRGFFDPRFSPGFGSGFFRPF